VAQFRAVTEFRCEPRIVFDFLIRPANVLMLSPPDVQVRMLEGPEVVQLGSRVTIEARNFGVRQRFSVRIVEWEQDRLLTDEQVEGPFGAYRHRREFELSQAGSRMIEVVDFQPPKGLMGMLLSTERLSQYLSELHEHRIQAMKRLLEEVPGDPK
jgi:ligand-binding SRPBCC domain-containing protein